MQSAPLDAMYTITVSQHVTILDEKLARKEPTAADSENGFYATLTAQADTDSNQQPGSSKIRHASHSATRLGNLLNESIFSLLC
jgi:hypothetical protein